MTIYTLNVYIFLMNRSQREQAVLDTLETLSEEGYVGVYLPEVAAEVAALDKKFMTKVNVGNKALSFLGFGPMIDPAALYTTRLYPVTAKLERVGAVTSEWDDSPAEGRPRRRVYKRVISRAFPSKEELSRRLSHSQETRALIDPESALPEVVRVLESQNELAPHIREQNYSVIQNNLPIGRYSLVDNQALCERRIDEIVFAEPYRKPEYEMAVYKDVIAETILMGSHFVSASLVREDRELNIWVKLQEAGVVTQTPAQTRDGEFRIDHWDV